MVGKGWRACASVALVGLLALVTARADDTTAKEDPAKPGKAPGAPAAPGAKTAQAMIPDEGMLSAFKSKKLDIKAKGEASFTLTVPAGKEITVTVASAKKTDVNLFVYDATKKELAKDVSPGPDCRVTFTPKEAGKVTLVVRNLGPGDNTSTVKASLSKP